MQQTQLSPRLESLRPTGKAGPVFAGNVTLENVSYEIGGKLILDSVSLNVDAGKVVCILGRSGCGKTTLLRLIAGIIRPTSGRILLDGTVVSGPNIYVPPERRSIGLMFQDYALFPHMTALENVAYGLYALQRSEALNVATMALERVGLRAVAQQYPATLSGGEQQRVALARALVPRPQVLMMDEPFSGLDQRLKESVRDETLTLLRETRATALLVTHDPDEALAFADQIYLMGQGRVLQSGSPEDLLHSPVSVEVAQFFRSHFSLNGIVTQGQVETPFGTLKAKHFADSTRVTLLVPPTGFEITTADKAAPATIIENRVLGGTRRLVLKLENFSNPVLVHSDVSFVGPCGLALNGKHTHIFEATD